MSKLISTESFPKVAENILNQVFQKDFFSLSGQSGYPPYNAWIEQDGSYKIEIAVAGFSKNEITVNFDGSILSITGEKKEFVEDPKKHWLCRGLARRKFIRQFDVRGSFFVDSAVLKNGILMISLKNETRKFEIEVLED